MVDGEGDILVTGLLSGFETESSTFNSLCTFFVLTQRNE